MQCDVIGEREKTDLKKMLNADPPLQESAGASCYVFKQQCMDEKFSHLEPLPPCFGFRFILQFEKFSSPVVLGLVHFGFPK